MPGGARQKFIFKTSKIGVRRDRVRPRLNRNYSRNYTEYEDIADLYEINGTRVPHSETSRPDVADGVQRVHGTRRHAATPHAGTVTDPTAVAAEH